MIRRLYVHNFRCLENFELPISGQSSVLLIGKNGSGKTTVGLALEILQKLARGTSQVGALVTAKDFSRGQTDVPMRLELEVDLGGSTHEYVVAFELPSGFREPRVREEKLSVDGKPVYVRELSKVEIPKPNGPARFNIDWHLVPLPIVQEQSPQDFLAIFKKWLARMLILRPAPRLIFGDSKDETLQPNVDVTDFGAWFSGLVSFAPAAYATVDGYLRTVMPDFKDIKNPLIARDSRSLTVQFADGPRSMTVPFEDLSDGEKCFMICALVLAASNAYGPLFCFWDEPDNYLAPDEVGHFVLGLRKAFEEGGQFVCTSHDSEAIRNFSNETTLLLHRRSHPEPAIARRVQPPGFRATSSTRSFAETSFHERQQGATSRPGAARGRRQPSVGGRLSQGPVVDPAASGATTTSSW